MQQNMKDDELIAGFDSQMVWYTPPNTTYEPYWKRNNLQVHVKYFKYQSSWDWLMPVIEKIERLGWESKLSSHSFELIKSGRFRVIVYFNHSNEWLDDEGTCGSLVYKYLAANSKIAAVRKAIVEFITWYKHHQED